MGRVCAYCGKKRRLTQEHIFSRCLLERQDRIDAARVKRIPKLIGPDLTIGDVCEVCNNVRLEETDDYICELYDAYFHEYAWPSGRITFSYDYDLLVRWLMKTAYNSNRAYHKKGKKAFSALSSQAPFMLGKEDLTVPVSVMLLLVGPAPDPQKMGAILLPDYLGAKQMVFGAPKLEEAITYLIVLNSYFFFIMMHPDGKPALTLAKNRLLGIGGIVELSSGSEPVDVQVACDIMQAAKVFRMFE